MDALFIAIGLGVIGGGVRALVGFLKQMQLKEKFDRKSLFIYVIILLVVGAFSGVVLDYGRVLSFLGGYAGIDLMEGYYKTFMKQSVKIKKK
ncbi:hypothetical protein HOD75_01000 [archaeon]|jgi:hypothetical protein|nr:hypothetical protein [archaeon]MBT4241455.1 hypothetical protein [archaeon]MBT4417674.1 hypothetical protein [archaeon]